MKSEKQKFDERQMLARARAGNMGFFILLITLSASCSLRLLLGREWASPEAELSVLIAPAFGAYVARCIYTGAYFQLREDGRWFKWLCAGWVALGAVAAWRTISRGSLIEGGMLTSDCSTPLLALIYLAALVAMALKRVKDRREEKREKQETELR